MVEREVFWAVPTTLQYLMYIAGAISVSIFTFGVWSRTSVWTTGRDDNEFAGFGVMDFVLFAIKSFFSPNCIMAKKSFQLASYRGIMLLFIIYGFLTLLMGTILLTFHHYFVEFLTGGVYLVFSFLLDIAGLLLMIGLVIAIARRHLVPEVNSITSREDLFFLYIFLLIAISGFTVEGTRLAALSPPNMDYSIGGALFSTIIGITGLSPASIYTTLWSLHVFLVMFLIAYLPFSKFFHIFAAQISVAAAEKRYGGAIGGK